MAVLSGGRLERFYCSAKLVTDDNAMVRWICKRKITDRARMSDMHRIFGIKDLESTLRTGRLRWYGHLERQPNDNVAKCS